MYIPSQTDRYQFTPVKYDALKLQTNNLDRDL